jgi:outer membrane protein assembly factor BamB
MENPITLVHALSMKVIARVMMRGTPARLALPVLVWLPGAIGAEDWPEWRGPRRDGVSLEKDWLSAWPAGRNPEVSWRARVGRGHSAVSVSGGRAFTLGWDGKEDTVHCFDAHTGKPAWKQSYASETVKQWPGPRTTPTVHGGRVYTLGQHGQLNAYDASEGTPLWSIRLPGSIMADHDYGFAWSPLIEGGCLIFCAGGGGLAIRVEDGVYAWGNDGKAGTCASAVRHERNGRREVVLLLNDGGRNVFLAGIDPSGGKEVWRSGPWPEKWGAACVDPLVAGGHVFLTTAEQNARCARFTIVGDKLVEDWSSSRLACYTGSCVLVGGCIFGITKSGILKCLDWKTGKELWAERGFDGHGALMAADGLLIIQTSEQGKLVVARAGRERYEELRRSIVFEGDPGTFTAPVLANGRLYCRSYAGEVVSLLVSRE